MASFPSDVDLWLELDQDAEQHQGVAPQFNPVKILYSHRTASKDGQAVHIEEMIASFRRLGHEVIVVGPAFSDQQEFGGESGMLSMARKYCPKAVLELLEFCYSFLAYRDLVAAYRKHQPDILYERFNLFFLAGKWLHRKYRIPFFLEVNAPIFEERAKYGGIGLGRFAKWCQETVWQNASMTLPVSHVLADYIYAADVARDRVTVIPNGINPREFLVEFDREAGKSERGYGGQIVIGFTGFIRDWHGLEHIIDWIADFDQNIEVHLLVVGDGPALSELRQHAKNRNVENRVTFTGLVARKDIPGIVSTIDIALQPGVTDYASPLKVIEYMALGCAIVAPRQPNIEEILAHEKTALLFEAADTSSMRAQIERLCIDDVLRRQLGQAARRQVEDQPMTWDANARRLTKMFEKSVSDAVAQK